MTPHSIKNLDVEVRDTVALVWFDMPNAKVNVLSRALSQEFEHVFDSITQNQDVSSIVLISRKKDSFIAGADIEEFQHFSSSHEATELSRLAQSLVNRIAASPKPVLCAIHGSCLGGGLEVALACHYRVATDHPKTTLGLPEVLLGLLPGAGGTQRLPRLVGLSTSLSLLLTGRKVRTREAKKIGLVDLVTSPHGLADIACDAARRLVDGRIKPTPQNRATPLGVLENTPIGNVFISLAMHKARAQVMQKTRGLYPAPLRIIEVVEEGLKKGMKTGLALEAKRFGELAQTSVCKNLVQLFFLQKAHQKNHVFRSKETVDTIGVIGAGFMGTGITLVSVQNDLKVFLNDSHPESLGKAEKQIWTELSHRVTKRAISAFSRDQMMSRIFAQNEFAHMQKCELVVEAIFEDLKLKQKTLAELEPHLNEHCVFASNTSAIPISEIAKKSLRKDRIIGMHYFSPVQKMPLLEIVVTPETSRETTGLAIDVGLRQGKTIIVVKDSPGFYTTRIVAPFMDEAAILALEGINPQVVDDAMQDFGFPVGPITLMDEVGLDVAGHVAKELTASFGKRFSGADWRALDVLTSANSLGLKSGKGFYVYRDHKSKKLNAELKPIIDQYKKPARARPSDSKDIQHRIAMRMINEAVFCLQEGILSNPGDGDLGAVFGLGFPPFLGGPFRYVDSLGASKVLGELQRLHDQLGERFLPAPLLIDMAKGGKKFHSA